MIVTSQPDVPCDVCGRRLLRGEQPDVFLASGRRRTVCELCAPRATHEGWLRETDHLSVTLPPARPRRGRNLLGRLRGLRESEDEIAMGFVEPLSEDAGQGVAYGLLESSTAGIATLSDSDQPEHASSGGASPAPGVPFAGAELDPAAAALTGVDLQAQHALEAFNASEHPRRVAGVARSLGEPSVNVRARHDSAQTIAIVIAWELSWYRYEVDLGLRAQGANVVAQGTELSELSEEDRAANAIADADGTLSLV